MAHPEYVARKAGGSYDEAIKNVKDKSSNAVLEEVKKRRDYAKSEAKNQARTAVEKNGGKFDEKSWDKNYDKSNRNFGEFDEAPGGGSPVNGGGRGVMKKNFVVAESPDDPKAVKAKEKGEKVRYMQPRADDGTFTYNSANGKGLSTNKSRGTTDMPWLAGIDLTFLQKGAVFKTNDPEMGRLLSSVTLTAQEMHDAMAIYYKAEGGFAGIVGAMITKKGRESSTEKTGFRGQVNKVDTSTMSENTQNRLKEAGASVEKGPFRVGKSVTTGRTGAYDPKKTRKGTDRPSESGTRNYSQNVSEEEMKQYASELSKQMGTEVSLDDLKYLIDAGIVNTEDISGNDYENKIKKSMGLEETD